MVCYRKRANAHHVACLVVALSILLQCIIVYNSYQWLAYFLASVDVDAVARNMDFVTLQDNVMNITFCNIESELVCLCLLLILYPVL